MRKTLFLKLKNYLINPDISNKFLIKGIKELPSFKNDNISLMYIFRQRNPYSFIAIKSLMMISGIICKNSKTFTKIIVLKFAKRQIHSLVLINLNFFEYAGVMSLYAKKPASLKKSMTSYIAENKHFIFPGYIKHLRMSSWKKDLILSYNKENKEKYWFFFYKTIFVD